MTPVKLLCAFLLFPAVAVGLVLAGSPAQPEARAEIPPAPAAPAPVLGEPEVPGDWEAEGLAGQWGVAFVEASGKAAFADDELKDAWITFKDGAAVVEGVEFLFVKDFTFKVDAAKQPKEIDVTFTEGPMKGKTFAGIYVSREKEVRVCLRLKNTNLGRPKGFSTVSGAGLYMCFPSLWSHLVGVCCRIAVRVGVEEDSVISGIQCSDCEGCPQWVASSL